MAGEERKLTFCLRWPDHARIDAAGVGRCAAAAAAAMDERLLQLPEPEVGSRRGRRLEVPAQAVAHTEPISHRPPSYRRGRQAKLLAVADKNFSRMERPRPPRASTRVRRAPAGQQIRMRKRWSRSISVPKSLAAGMQAFGIKKFRCVGRGVIQPKWHGISLWNQFVIKTRIKGRAKITLKKLLRTQGFENTASAIAAATSCDAESRSSCGLACMLPPLCLG